MRRGGMGRGPGPGRGGSGRGRGGPGPSGRRSAGMRRRSRRRVRRQRRRRRRMILLVGGMVAFGAYKLSKRDVQRVEEQTGRSAEELSDEEMEQAMDELNIEKQSLSEEDQAYIYEQDGGGESSYLDDIERLGKLRDDGYITNEEFERKKQELLG